MKSTAYIKSFQRPLSLTITQAYLLFPQTNTFYCVNLMNSHHKDHKIIPVQTYSTFIRVTSV